MGSVKEHYIHFESAGDQFVGRTVYGVTNTTALFAISPCYFDFSEVEDGDVKRDQLNKWIKDNNVGGHHFIPKIQYLTRFLFASLCYHWDYLSENLHPTSRLLSLPLISQCPEDF